MGFTFPENRRTGLPRTASEAVMKRQHVTKNKPKPQKASPSAASSPVTPSDSWKKRLLTTLVLALLGGGAFAATFLLVRSSRPSTTEGMAWIPGGEFTMGTDDEIGRPEEKPAHLVRVDGFFMDETDVTDAQFRQFVEAPGDVSTAEKPPDVEEIMRQVEPGQEPPAQETLVPASL